MIIKAEPELICDFAEVYHIYDYQALPVMYAATLASGLGENSRVVRKLSGDEFGVDTLLLATIADRLSYLVWFQTEDARKHCNRPKSIVDTLMGRRTEEEKPQGFSSKEELDRALAQFERK